MSFSGGIYAAPSNSWNPAVSGATINATDWAALLADLSSALSTCVLKDGTQTITANLPMSGFKFTGLAAGSASGNSLRYEQVIGVMQTLATLTAKGDLYVGTASATSSALNVGVNGTSLVADSSQTTGLNYKIAGAQTLGTIAGTNTITAVGAPAPTAYALGQAFYFVPLNTNTGATTINIGALGAKNIFASGAAMTGGELVANTPALIFYDGTQFQLIGPPVQRGSFTITLTGFTAGVTGTAVFSITNNVVTLFIPTLSGTSNVTTMTATGLPTAITPVTNHFGLLVGGGADNGGNLTTPVRCDVNTTSTITFYPTAASSSSWTNANTKGFVGGITLTYGLN